MSPQEHAEAIARQNWVDCEFFVVFQSPDQAIAMPVANETIAKRMAAEYIGKPRLFRGLEQPIEIHY